MHRVWASSLVVTSTCASFKHIGGRIYVHALPCSRKTRITSVCFVRKHDIFFCLSFLRLRKFLSRTCLVVVVSMVVGRATKTVDVKQMQTTNNATNTQGHKDHNESSCSGSFFSLLVFPPTRQATGNLCPRISFAIPSATLIN